MDNFLGSIIILVIFSIFYIPFVWWLYTINKKLGEKHPWLSFLPILQYYNFAQAANKSLLYYVVFPFLVIIITTSYIFYSLVTRSPSWSIIWTLTLISYLYFIIMWVKLNHGISKRCERWVWSTLWLLFIPFIMFPIVAYKLKVDTKNTWSETLNKEKQDTIEL